ncbi:MAG: hypothetical protein CBC42_04600 [Betaproteobacteria bacterium TMED82]|nr:MAG: hypothetical protein CBC42_04600 [Betaproteobacteria bacterium TMED82]|tara:strand:+ start:8464 stop:8721 length:258 start_codon:yes stop_codon:yes gene_type:complete
MNIKKLLPAVLPVVSLSCAPPLEDKCYSEQMDKWESAVVVEKNGGSVRYIFDKNLDGVLEEQYYLDSEEGKILFQSQAWAKCTSN